MYDSQTASRRCQRHLSRTPCRRHWSRTSPEDHLIWNMLWQNNMHACIIEIIILLCKLTFDIII